MPVGAQRVDFWDSAGGFSGLSPWLCYLQGAEDELSFACKFRFGALLFFLLAVGAVGTFWGADPTTGHPRGVRVPPGRLQRKLQGRQSVPKSWGQSAESWWQLSAPGNFGMRGVPKSRVMFPFAFALWHHAAEISGYASFCHSSGINFSYK